MEFTGDGGGGFTTLPDQLRQGAQNYERLAGEIRRRGNAMQDAFAGAVGAAGDPGVADSLALSADVFVDAANDIANEVDDIAGTLRENASNYDSAETRSQQAVRSAGGGLAL